jgi:hypothetical protein
MTRPMMNLNCSKRQALLAMLILHLGMVGPHTCARLTTPKTVSSATSAMQHVRHANDPCASRPNPYKAPCRSMRCEYRSFSTDVLARHHRDDHHASNDSHRAHCPRPEYTYSNDSIVGVSVHILHVHSEAAVAYRKQAAERRRQGEMLAARLASDARRAALGKLLPEVLRPTPPATPCRPRPLRRSKARETTLLAPPQSRQQESEDCLLRSRSSQTSTRWIRFWKPSCAQEPDAGRARAVRPQH